MFWVEKRRLVSGDGRDLYRILKCGCDIGNFWWRLPRPGRQADSKKNSPNNQRRASGEKRTEKVMGLRWRIAHLSVCQSVHAKSCIRILAWMHGAQAGDMGKSNEISLEPVGGPLRAYKVPSRLVGVIRFGRC